MRLWLLRRDKFTWDETAGFVIRAETEKHARQIAVKESGERPERWLTEASCMPLTDEGEPGVMLCDYNAG